MAPRKIISVGFQLATDEVTYADFQSRNSLLDWDIVLFRPDIAIAGFLSYQGSHLGKPSLNETSSFKLREACEHWHREIREAIKAGKTMIVFLPPLQQVYVDTGDKTVSGTGRNQKVTRLVDAYDNYKSIPLELGPLNSSGRAIKVAPQCPEDVAAFWSELKDRFEYHVVLQSTSDRHLVTRTGDKPVSAMIHDTQSCGTLLVVPDINFSAGEFFRNRNDEQYWTPGARQFASQFVAAVVSFDRARRSHGELTVQPEWSLAPDFELGSEAELRKKLQHADQELEAATLKRGALATELRSAGRLRNLLFEKGKPLEVAILEALRIMGFKAEPFKDASSEFDVVFECEEGRLIGEAEGKDSKPINIDKLRQLQMNVHEDLQRDEVSTPAKPVLFGNAFRLSPPAERPEPFTQKCIEASATSSTALVTTADLFAAVQYLNVRHDEDYARACRSVLLTTTGRVVFPPPPPIEAKEPAAKKDLKERSDPSAALKQSQTPEQ